MKLPSFVVPVLQANVYSSREGAEQFLKELAGRGIASTSLAMDGLYYVLIGSADTYSTAKLLATHMQTEELEVYAKEITIKGGEEISFPTEDEARQFSAEHELFPKLAGEAAIGLLTGEINADVLAEVDKVLQAGPKENNVEGKIKELHTKLVTAHSHLTSFSSNSADVEKVKAAQQALLEYIVLYHFAST
ncbi:SPOR domain-containing protein [Bacillus sp. N9]